MGIPGKLYKDYFHFNDILQKIPFSVCFLTFYEHIQKVRTKSWFLCPQLRSMSHTPNLAHFRRFGFLFVMASQIFVVEQFGIRRWKANKNINLTTTA